MPAQKDPHTASVSEVTYWCVASFDRAKFWIRIQSTLVTRQSSPEPDFAIMDYPSTASTGGYASSSRAVLVIEVSDSTLLADTTNKMSLYASGGVPE